MNAKSLVKWIGFALSAVLLFLFLRGVDVKEMSEAFKSFRVIFLVPSLVIYLFSFVVRGVRWQILLKPLKSISLSTSFVVLMISWMANNLLPARMGELVRAFVIGKKEGISASGSFATVVLERVLDGIVLVAFLLLCLLAGGFSRQGEGGGMNPTEVGIIAGGIFAGAFAFLFLLFARQSLALRIAGWFLKPLPVPLAQKIQGLLESFVSGLACLKSGWAFLWVMVLSVLVWVCEAGTLFFLFKGFSFALPPTASFFVLSILNLGILIPAAPGYVGTFEVFGSESLALFGIGKTLAKSFAVSAHAVQFIPVTILGLLFLYREGLGLSVLSEKSRDTKK